MSRFSNLMKKDNVCVTVTDRVLELISLTLYICIVGLSVFFYINAPDRIPIHFDGVGNPNGWGGKIYYLYTPLMGLLVMGLCSIAAYHHKMINLPITLNPKCMPLQLALMRRLARVMTVLVGVLFVFITLSMAAPQMHWNPKSFSTGAFLVLVVLLGVIVYYTIRIQSVGKCYR